MKNYYIDDGAREFIESYIISRNGVGEEIVLSLGSGEKYVIPNTEENRARINRIMREQLEKSKAVESSLQKKKKVALLFEKIFKRISRSLGIASIPINVLSVVILRNYFQIPISSASVFGLCTTAATLFLAWTIYIKSCDFKEKRMHYESIIDDIDKHIVYNHIEDKLQLYLDSNNPNLMLGIQNETKTKLKSFSKPNIITFNTIHTMTLDELKTLRENIWRIEHFDFEGDSHKQGSKEKAKTMVMSPKNPINQ